MGWRETAGCEGSTGRAHRIEDTEGEDSRLQWPGTGRDESMAVGGSGEASMETGNSSTAGPFPPQSTVISILNVEDFREEKK